MSHVHCYNKYPATRPAWCFEDLTLQPGDVVVVGEITYEALVDFDDDLILTVVRDWVGAQVATPVTKEPDGATLDAHELVGVG